MKNHYPSGTNDLWMVHFMPQDNEGNITAWGSMDGHALKLDGTLEEAIQQAVMYANELDMVIQCIRRRY